MRSERLESLPSKLVAFDTETYLIKHDDPTPKMVCGSAGWFTGQHIEGAFLDKDVAREVFAQALDDQQVVLGGANIAYDLDVMVEDFARLGIDLYPSVFQMLDPGGRGLCEDGRVYDLQIAEALGAIAEGLLGKDPRTGGPLKNPETGKPGSYSLSMCVDLVLGRQDAKANDLYRLRYGELDGVPVDQWPAEARDYPKDDAVNTAEVILAQAGHLPRVASQHDWHNVVLEGGRQALVCRDCKTSRISAMCQTRRPQKNLHEVARQTMSAYCLRLGDVRGLLVDQSRVDLIEDYFTRKRQKNVGRFVAAGVIREDGSEDQSRIKRLVALAYGSSEECPHCAGTGEVPHPEQPTLRCPDCRGRCQPWKSGGKIKPPEVENCATCRNTARVPHPVVKMTKCTAPDGDKSCCGTGLVLTSDVPRSDTDDVSISRDTLSESSDDFLGELAAYKEDAKTLNDYIPYLRTARLCTLCAQPGTKKLPHLETCPSRMGIRHGWRDIYMKLRANVILETGRVSYRGYAQTFPRAPGFVDRDEESPTFGQYIYSLRECFVANHEEWEFVEVGDDYQLQVGEELAVA